MTERTTRFKVTRRSIVATVVIVGLTSAAAAGVLAVNNIATQLQTYAVGEGATDGTPALSGGSGAGIGTSGEEAVAIDPPTSPSDFEATRPTLGPDGLRYDQWGARLLDATTDLATIEYPAHMSEEEKSRYSVIFEQEQIIARCMGEKGFDYWFKTGWDSPAADRGVAQYAVGTPGYAAEYGTAAADAAYDWETAGCRGYAVHVMGLDSAN